MTTTATPTVLLSALGAMRACSCVHGTLWVLGYDAARLRADVLITKNGEAKRYSIDARQPVTPVEATPVEVAAFAAYHKARDAAAAKRAAALAALRPGLRVEWTEKGKTATGTITRVNAKTVSVLGDDGREWRITPGLLRPSAVAAPAALPEHPAMVRWTLGKTRYGLDYGDGRSWEQPLLLDGRRVALLQDEGHGGCVDVHGAPAALAQLRAGTIAWAAAVGEHHDGDTVALWRQWTLNERPRGIAYQTVAQRYGKG